MVEKIFDDVRHVLLSMLFVISFGWMAAQVVPGAIEASAGPQIAQAEPAVVTAR